MATTVEGALMNGQYGKEVLLQIYMQTSVKQNRGHMYAYRETCLLHYTRCLKRTGNVNSFEKKQ